MPGLYVLDASVAVRPPPSLLDSGYRASVSNTNMIWWMVVGWLPAVLVWSFSDDLFTTAGGVVWLGFMYWVFWRRSQQEP